MQRLRGFFERAQRRAVAVTSIILVAASATGAQAETVELLFPSLEYRTGPYAIYGEPIADGFTDYFTLINERDGGIGGVPVKVLPCEMGYNTQKGVECYESLRDLAPLVIHPQSTGVAYQLIPKAADDEIPIHTLGYGRAASGDGEVFKWAFNFPLTQWDAASVMIQYILDQESSSLKDRRIALLYHNSAYGKDPIPTLEALSDKHGFELSLIPVDHPGREQKAQWLQIRRERPDYVLLWGWTGMVEIALKEAANVRFPMDKFIGNLWSGSDAEIRNAGKSADGYKAITMHDIGDNYPVYRDLRTYVHTRGLSAGKGSHIGTSHYNHGLLAAMLAVEAARRAQANHGVAQITPAEMRDGMEALELDAARLRELGFRDFIPPFAVSCSDHAAPGMGAIKQWDVDLGEWRLVSDFIAADRDITGPRYKDEALSIAKEAGFAPRDCPAPQDVAELPATKPKEDDLHITDNGGDVEITPIHEVRSVVRRVAVLEEPNHSASVVYILNPGQSVYLRLLEAPRTGDEGWILVDLIGGETQQGYVFVAGANTAEPVIDALFRSAAVTETPGPEPATSRGPVLGYQTGVTEGRRDGDYGRKIALVVGVSDYEHLPSRDEATRATELSDLEYAEKDASDFADALEQEDIFGTGWKIHRLIGKDATEDAIEQKIDEVFAGSLRNNDLVYFFFAGHGRVNPINSRDVRLLAYDSDDDNPRAGIEYASFQRNFFGARAGYAVAFIDACRSGSIGFGRGADRPDQDLLGNVTAVEPTKVIFTAGSGSQRAFEDPNLKNGVFTHYLIRGLNGEARNDDDDHFVDLIELEEFVADEVSRHTALHPQMKRQTPRIFDSDGLYPDRFPLAIRFN